MASAQLREKEVIPVSTVPLEAVKVVHGNHSTSLMIGARDSKVYKVQLSNNVINDSSKIIKAYEGHRKRVTDVEYSASSNRIVSVSANDELIIWDCETKEHLAFRGYNRTITSVTLNTSENKIVTGALDGSFVLWNTLGEQMSVFDKRIENAHCGGINACSFIPNTVDYLATGSEDGTVKIWDIDNYRLLKTFFDGSLVDFEKAKTERLPVFNTSGDMGVKAISFSKDGQILAYGGRNGKVYLINLNDNELLTSFDVSDRITAVASGVNQPLIAVAIPNMILVWDIIANELIAKHTFATCATEKYCYSLAFSDDELIAALDSGKVLRLEISRN
ncbi:guanine nucleotide-binding protein subunit beta-2-like 1 protein [Enteropsectra breve]|nr:guanine nucleotide-binding protein subunit beta-2-like 1 protein [Enteropsectra breve]